MLEVRDPGAWAETDHVGIMNNWVDAIARGRRLAPGEEGILADDLNAMHLSAWIDGWVELPIDEDLFYDKLQERVKTSTFKKDAKDVTLDVSGTY